MYAKNLESILDRLQQKSDASTERLPQISERFERLRGSAKLPRGRENRAKKLTAVEIINAVLGLVPTKPKWAAYGPITLAPLKPVGGSNASFFFCESLGAALVLLLESKEARDCFASVKLTLAETGTNSSGRAALTYDEGGQRKTAYFVPKEAVSLFNAGSELSFDAESRHAPMAREVIFNQAFFVELTREIELAQRLRLSPLGDGSEYDNEESEKARLKRLGVTNRSRFLNVGVENQVTWPKEAAAIKFDRYTFILLPKTKDHVQSIHVDLVGNKINQREARTAINRFLSVMSWCDDNFAIAGFGWSGTPVPVAVPKKNLAFTMASNYIFDRKIPSSEKAQRALALYREAINARFGGMISFAVLNFYKIIELKYPGKTPKKWFRDNFGFLEAAKNVPADSLKEFNKLRGSTSPEEYLYTSCRIAVAHASEKSKSDPDDADEVIRLHTAARVLQALAKIFIEKEFAISDLQYSGD